MFYLIELPDGKKRVCKLNEIIHLHNGCAVTQGITTLPITIICFNENKEILEDILKKVPIIQTENLGLKPIKHKIQKVRKKLLPLFNEELSACGNKILAKRSAETIPLSLLSSGNEPSCSYSDVARKKNSSKKNACLYCGELFAKITPHLERKHDDQKDVKSFMCLQKGCSERRKIIETIRRYGNYEYNMKNKNNIITCRRTKKPIDYIPCGNCRGYFSKQALRKHARLCCEKKNGKRNVLVMSRRLTYNLLEKACTRLKEDILPVLRSQEVVGVIRNDPFLIQYGNNLCSKYRTSAHFDDLIRTRLRTMVKFFLEVKKIYPFIERFEEILNPLYYDGLVRALDILGKLDEQSGRYGAPSTVFNLGIWLKQISKFFIARCIQEGEHEKKSRTESLLTLMTQMFTSTVNKAVSESQRYMQRNKKHILPVTSDIQKLNEFLLKNRRTTYDNLQKNGFSCTEWKNLASFTLISIQVFNRRRPGEIERLFIENFQNRQAISENDNPDVYNKLDHSSKEALKLYVRCVTRGKLNRDVPILMTKEIEEYINYIINHRKLAGVMDTNNYVFGMPSERMPYLRACKLLRTYSEICGAQNPENLRATKLRKHIATQSVTYNLRESQIEYLADHMGHDKQIHKKVYRLPILTRDIAFVSQILRRAQGDDEVSESIKQKKVSKNATITTNDDNGAGQIQMNTQCTSTTNSRKFTTENEEDVNNVINNVESSFIASDDDNSELGNLSNKKLSESSEVIGNNGYNHKSANSVTIKECIMREFGSHINSALLPSHDECTEKINNIEELATLSPVELRSLIAQEIEKDFRHQVQNCIEEIYSTPGIQNDNSSVNSVLHKPSTSVQRRQGSFSSDDSMKDPNYELSDEEEESLNDNFTSKTSKRSNLKFKNTKCTSEKNVGCFRNNKKRTWSTPEKKDAREFLRHFRHQEKLPSLKMCRDYIADHPSLTERTPAQLKAWINNELVKAHREKLNTTPTKMTAGKVSWITPERLAIRSAFRTHLQNQTLPSLEECSEARLLYPVLDRRTDQVIKAHVNNEIKRRKLRL